MALVQLATQGWSPLVDSSGNARTAVAFTLETLALVPVAVPVYSDSTGATALTADELVTGARGTFPGFAAPGTYTLTVGGVSEQVEVVSGRPGGVILLTASGSIVTDTAALAAAAAALPSSGGTIEFGDGVFSLSAFPSFAGKTSVTIKGQGGRSGGGAPGTRVVYTGTAALNATNTLGFRIADLALQYTSGSLAGKLIDLSGGSKFGSFDRCTIIGTLGSATGATSLFSFANTNDMTVRDCLFDYAVCAIRGKDIAGDYSNAVRVIGCQFGNMSQAAIQSGGQGWFLVGTGEPLASGNAGLYAQTVGAANGVAFSGWWIGDSGASGTWISFSGTGLSVTGNYLTGGNTGIALAASTFGVLIAGNHFEGFGANAQAKGIDVAANCVNLVIVGNYFKDSGATIVTAPITLADNPTGSLIQNGTGIEVRLGQGSVASAANVALTGGKRVYTVTGTTNITSITASWPGRVVTLGFADVLTVTDGSNLILAGNFVTTASDTITLYSDGTNWIEVSRSVN